MSLAVKEGVFLNVFLRPHTLSLSTLIDPKTWRGTLWKR